jgi:hypothetical protein
MKAAVTQLRADWSIIVADDHGPEWAPSIDDSEQRSPVQYRRLGGTRTLLQKALERGAQLASPWRLLVTLRDEYRSLWEPSLWYVRPRQRFVCDHRRSGWLTAAAALLRIARESPSAVVGLLPARCFVAQEETLAEAMAQALFELPSVPEGVVSLGMTDFDLDADEDYLVPETGRRGPTLRLHGVARRPTAWIARSLRDSGAMVASEIMIGYVGAFAAHISQRWPGVSARLLRLIDAASLTDTETWIPSCLQRGAPAAMLSALRWYPPSLPQRALRVMPCGWSGLRTAASVARLSADLPSLEACGRPATMGHGNFAEYERPLEQYSRPPV